MSKLSSESSFGLATDSPLSDMRSRRDTAQPAWPLRILLSMLRDLDIGSLDVLLPGGAVRHLRGTQKGPHGVIQLHSPAVFFRVLTGGEVGLGDAYIEGLWDSPDLSALLEVLYRNEQRVRGPYERNTLGRLWGWLQHRMRRNTRSGSQHNIQQHYDLGNAFYQQWLDPTLTYSSAVFASPEQSLEAAQHHKLALLRERLQLTSDHHLLEIGSGWGAFAIQAAQVTGCRVTSITLSHEQLREAQALAQAAGVADRVEFRLQDYRDVCGEYDRVVSIEMYEAVGEEYWPLYFQTIQRLLKPGGLAAIQGITIDPALFEHYRTKRDFIQKYIFPGGMLAPPELLQQRAREAGLECRDPAFYGADYALTLAHWAQSVDAVADSIRASYDERFLRMWRYYLAYCQCGFQVGSIDLMHLTLGKPGVAR